MKKGLYGLSGLMVAALLTACGGDSNVEVTSTAYSNCALSKDTNQVKCWGYGESYNFANGLDETIGDDADETGDGVPVAQLGDKKVLHAAANEHFGCALFEDETVSCWGENSYVGLDDPSSDESRYTGDSADELGNNLPVINFGDGLSVKQLSVGNSHACVILNNDRVKCWGDAGDGRLGYGDKEDRGDDAGEMGNALPFVDLGTNWLGQPYKVKQIAAGWDLTCAVLKNDQLKCWGDNGSAQLGYGDFEHRGDDPNEMGNQLPFVDLGKYRKVEEVFVYYRHTCAILKDGALKCWGSNGDGEIGIGTGDTIVGNNVPRNGFSRYCAREGETYLYTETQIDAGDPSCIYGGIQYLVGLDANGNGELDGDESFPGPRYCHVHDMNIATQVTELAAGSEKCTEGGGFEITSDFDNNGDGKIGDGTENNMGDNLPEIDFGSHSPVVDVLQGDDHTCALLKDHTLKCWGDNSYGQSGLDLEDEWGNGPGETPANRNSPDLGTDLYPVSISGSYTYSCAVLNDDSIKCWGYDDDYATLGVPEYFEEYIGDGKDSDGAVVQEMGDNLKKLNLFPVN